MSEPQSSLELGAVYKVDWDDRLMRIIGFDEIEVFYDCLLPHNNKWVFSGNFKKKGSFYRVSNKTFSQRSQKIDSIPFSDEEHAFFRPDLILRIGRTDKINWNDFTYADNEFFDYIRDSMAEDEYKKRIDTDRIVLTPYGPKGVALKGIEVALMMARFFIVPKLLEKAKIIQEAANPQVSNGIGIYRLGFENGLPSYYIGQFFDKAGILQS